MLPSYDAEFLGERHDGWSATAESGTICVLIPSLALPPGFTVAESNLLLRLSTGYPDIKPDMWWFEPFVLRSDGRPIAATDCRETYLGRVWQRWSRHLQPHQWRSGVDSLESYLSLVYSELASAAKPLAA